MSFYRSNYHQLTPQTNYLQKRTSPPKQQYSDHKSKKYPPKSGETEKKKGPFAYLRQHIYTPSKTTKKPTTGTYIIKEELEVQEISQDEIYNFNLGQDKFLELLRKKHSSSTTPTMQIIDNYYLYQFVYSVKNKYSVSYQDEIVEGKYLPDKKVYQRTIHRTYLPTPNDFDSYCNYHLIVRIIRFLIDQEIYEIIIPRKTSIVPTTGTPVAIPYQVSDDFWKQLIDPNQLIKLPKDTNFIIRRSVGK